MGSLGSLVSLSLDGLGDAAADDVAVFEELIVFLVITAFGPCEGLSSASASFAAGIVGGLGAVGSTTTDGANLFACGDGGRDVGPSSLYL